MLNILVPTDFSELSKVAVQYAIKIANRLDGKITLVHVVDVTPAVRISMRDKMKEVEDDLVAAAENNLNKLMREFSYDLQTTEPLKWSVVRGSQMNKALKKEAKRLRTGLIVMGTNGASGIKKALIGSNTNSVIELSDVPVLVVPAQAEFKGFKDIVYASDLRNLEKELSILIPYVEKFGSTIHLVHVEPTGKAIEEVEGKIEKTVHKMGYKNIVMLVLVDPFIEGAISQYIEVSKAELLAMFTHDLTFYEKLFDRSITRKMAFQSVVPLLAFKHKG